MMQVPNSLIMYEIESSKDDHTTKSFFWIIKKISALWMGATDTSTEKIVALKVRMDLERWNTS
ncbi:hypothetical protein NQ317_009467 [Molorchus minor]|uniref:Uncharacterized protein n=1 Tax=Molorchus minor TaxID=1323400 RepID=A0ABQ9IQJ2_9CUCU|nr:hypothetical protein NQ317_009467 [Molorchus minor]